MKIASMFSQLFLAKIGLDCILINFLCRCTGVRTFVPRPVATTLQYIGGAAAILGLVAMASDVEGLYAAVKALVCVVKSNPLASKEMERIKGYQVCKKCLKTDEAN